MQAEHPEKASFARSFFSRFVWAWLGLMLLWIGYGILTAACAVMQCGTPQFTGDPVFRLDWVTHDALPDFLLQGVGSLFVAAATAYAAVRFRAGRLLIFVASILAGIAYALAGRWLLTLIQSALPAAAGAVDALLQQPNLLVVYYVAVTTPIDLLLFTTIARYKANIIDAADSAEDARRMNTLVRLKALTIAALVLCSPLTLCGVIFSLDRLSEAFESNVQMAYRVLPCEMFATGRSWTDVERDVTWITDNLKRNRNSIVTSKRNDTGASELRYVFSPNRQGRSDIGEGFKIVFENGRVQARYALSQTTPMKPGSVGTGTSDVWIPIECPEP